LRKLIQSFAVLFLRIIPPPEAKLPNATSHPCLQIVHRISDSIVLPLPHTLRPPKFQTLLNLVDRLNFFAIIQETELKQIRKLSSVALDHLPHLCRDAFRDTTIMVSPTSAMKDGSDNTHEP
jgi:hypothetical protein